MMDADELRRRMKMLRRALDPAQQAQDSTWVCRRIQAHEAYLSARCVMAYMACGGELSIAGIVKDVLSSGRTLVLPRCESPGRMTARRIDSLEQLTRGRYGIAEPGESCAVVDPERIDLILAPGTAFDILGHRIGQGGGYYDRFLPDTHAYVMGVCHEFALHAGIPFQKHDRRMDAVATPLRIIDCG